MVLNVTELDHAVVSFFEQSKIPPAAMDELKVIISKGPAMEESALSDLVVRDIALIFTASHFEVRASSKLGAAHKGARPGHPYGDMVFSFVFTKF